MAVVGLLGLALVALRLFSGAITVSQAGLRAAVLLVVLLVAERVLLPVVRSLVGPARSD